MSNSLNLQRVSRRNDITRQARVNLGKGLYRPVGDRYREMRDNTLMAHGAFDPEVVTPEMQERARINHEIGLLWLLHGILVKLDAREFRKDSKDDIS